MRGYKRLFWAPTLLWAVFWSVLYPLHNQWVGQEKALNELSGNIATGGTTNARVGKRERCADVIVTRIRLADSRE